MYTPRETPRMPPPKPPTLTGPAKIIHDAVAAHRQGRTDWAIQLATSVRKHSAQAEVEADIVISEALFRAARYDELRAHLHNAVAFTADPRGALMSARLARATGDPAACERLLRSILSRQRTDPVDRMAAFELVKVLERSGRHDEAWRTAAAAHQRSTRPFDTHALIAALELTANAASDGRLTRIRRASRPAGRAAFILGMPRSGTTLIEQMLDAHPSARGVGELPIHARMADEISLVGGGWPTAAFTAPVPVLDRWQSAYAAETRAFHKLASNIWTIDKTVFPMLQPLILAAVFPGAKALCVRRDARDNAVSLFLNNFDPSWGWTASLDTIRAVIDAQRRFVPPIIEALGVEAVHIRLEDLVAQPEPTARAMLDLLGLPWNDACLHPERNARIVHTLSHEQVRRPINADGVGRWHKHAAHFDGSWSNLA